MNQEQNVTDAEVIESTPREITGDTVVSQANQDQQMTEQQAHDLSVWMRAAREAHGKQCRKAGHKHKHNPAGSKLSRKLEKTGNVYGRNSLVYQTFVDMREQQYKGTV